MKHKISLFHVPKFHYGIGGLTEPKNVLLWLSDEEYEKLNECLLKRVEEKNSSVVLALYDFTHSKVCSKHHRYKIWRTFEGISDIDYKYIGSSKC